MLQGTLKKYRGLFIAVTTIVVFFIAYLLINQALQQQALNGVRYVHTVSSIAQQLETAPAGDASIASSLNFLRQGGKIGDQEYKSSEKFLSPEQSSIGAVISAYSSGDIEQARSSMQTLVTQVNNKANKRVKLSRTLQVVAAILTALLYFLVVLPSFFRIKETDETVESTQKETEGIMGTVSEGLFLLNSDHEIGIEQSASLKGMFKLERDLEGNFFDFINDYVTQDSVNIARDYIELLFGDRVKERLVEDLNPLKQVEINLIRRDGSYENRYLDFKFKRVLVDGELSHLLGSVTDVTKQVMLEQQLIESKEEQEAQIDLLMSILHVDNQQLRTFFDSTEKSLNGINERLESRGHDDSQIRSKLRDISRDVHRIKGDAAALDLNNFEFAAHALEDEIDTVTKENKKLSGKLLIPTTTKLRDLFSELERMKSLMAKFANAIDSSGNAAPAIEAIQASSLAQTSEAVEAPTVDIPEETHSVDVDAEPAANDDESGSDSSDTSLHESLDRLAQKVAERSGIKAKFHSEGLDNDQIPEHLKETLNSTLVQMVRNSITHGGETPEQRSAQGKDETLTIKAEFKQIDDRYHLVLQDDGKGINSQKIIDKAFDKHLISEQQRDTFGPKEAMTLIFLPGFSSKSEVSLDGGRGVGLDLVFDMTKKLDGKISVKSAEGQFCRFLFNYPIG